jgi:hypothetical protein
MNFTLTHFTSPHLTSTSHKSRQFTPHHHTSHHFTNLHSTPTRIPLIVTTFLIAFLNVFSLQGKDASKLAGNRSQLLISGINPRQHRVTYKKTWIPNNNAVKTQISQLRLTVGSFYVTPCNEDTAAKKFIYDEQIPNRRVLRRSSSCSIASLNKSSNQQQNC